MTNFKNKDIEDNNYWISYADLMSGLMLMFLLIAILTLSNTTTDINYTDIASEYESIQDDLYFDLHNEFKSDLKKWHAKIDRKTLTLSFHEPDILFSKGQDHIKPLFKNILNNFYPRYVKIITQKKFKDNILEVRIEGHTSSEWGKKTTMKQAYISNMSLSQNRTSAVLKYVLSMRKIKDYKWIRGKIVSVGYSSSRIKITDGYEDKPGSRRVEFRVITDAESRLYDLINNQKKINKYKNQFAESKESYFQSY